MLPESNNSHSWFIVSIYLTDNRLVAIPRTDRVTIPLTRLYSGEVFAIDEASAAARVWVDQIGQYRQKRLFQQRAPQPIVDAQVEPALIQGMLKPSSLCSEGGRSFILDKQTEFWLLNVQPTYF